MILTIIWSFFIINKFSWLELRAIALGGSCRVKVPVGQGPATHPYRVLRGWRSGIGGLRPAVQANKSREA